MTAFISPSKALNAIYGDFPMQISEPVNEYSSPTGNLIINKPVVLLETPNYLFSMTPPQPLPRIEGGASVLIIS